MIDETFKKIEKRISGAQGLKTESREELRDLLETLRGEVTHLSKTHPEHSESIAGFADISSLEAVKANQQPELLKPALEGLEASVMEFENDHPKLAQLVNRISLMLSNMGI